MPTSLQYPLERERDVQRRWKHLLQRLAPKNYSSDNRKPSLSHEPLEGTVAQRKMVPQSQSAEARG